MLQDGQSSVLATLELKMPFAYVHLLNFMLLITMFALSFSLGMAQSCLGVVIFFIVQLVFFGVRELSVSLADPFGVDKVDFPAVMWMTSVYNRCVAICEDDWNPSLRPPLEKSSLQKIDWGRTVLDLQSDLHDKDVGCANQQACWDGGVQDPGPLYTRVPTEDPARLS